MRMVVTVSGLAMVLATASSAQVVDPLAPRPVAPPPSVAAAALSGFEAYKLRLADRARRDGVREATIQSVLPGLLLDGRVIRLDQRQPGNVANPNSFPPFAPYRREHVSAGLIARGKMVYGQNAARLASISARTGVDPFVVMSIFGHETSYGSVTGNFDLLRSLASLAYDGRRRDLFESEFVAALKLLERGTPRTRLKGSWAGATGYPQFMPSTVLRIGADGDGDGLVNIWTSQPDGLASIAAYLKEAGWKRGVRWGFAVRVPATLDRRPLASRTVAPRCPQVYARHSQWRSLREWRALGLAPLGSTGAMAEDEPLSLLEPDGPGATAYLLSHNYRVILDYNCSNFYALAVGLLADEIAGR